MAPGSLARGHSLFANASALFAGQAISLVVPLITIPYLARVLGPASWGPVLAAQALGNWLLLFVEFGFELWGTRAVARARTAPDLIPEIVHGVQSAKLLLSLIAAAIAGAVYLLVPSLRLGGGPALVAWAVTYGILRGLSPLWFFQGLERVRRAVGVDTIARVLAALGVFVVVHGPADNTRVVELQAVFAGLSLIVLTAWLGRHVPIRMPVPSAALTTIRETGYIFACRVSTGLYVQANTLIMSVLATPALVGFFGGAERIVRAAINLFQPLTQAFLPRVSFLHGSDRSTAHRTVRLALIGVGLLGLTMGGVAVLGAPLLVELILGPGYVAAVPVLRVLGVLLPLVAVNTVLGLYWALPFGHERSFLVAILAGGATNVGLALFLVPRLGAVGMASAAVVAESVVLAVLTTLYLRSDR